MKKSQKIAKDYSCEICDYYTVNHYDYKKHLSTRKHFSNESAIKSLKKSENSIKHHRCDICEKTYCDYSGLWRHKKKCIQQERISSNEINTEVVLELVKQNKEICEFMMNEFTKVKTQTQGEPVVPPG